MLKGLAASGSVPALNKTILEQQIKILKVLSPGVTIWWQQFHLSSLLVCPGLLDFAVVSGGAINCLNRDAPAVPTMMGKTPIQYNIKYIAIACFVNLQKCGMAIISCAYGAVRWFLASRLARQDPLPGYNNR